MNTDGIFTVITPEGKLTQPISEDMYRRVFPKHTKLAKLAFLYNF